MRFSSRVAERLKTQDLSSTHQPTKEKKDTISGSLLRESETGAIPTPTRNMIQWKHGKIIRSPEKSELSAPLKNRLSEKSVSSMESLRRKVSLL